LKVAADPNEPHWYALVQFHHITCDHETVDTVISEVVALLEHRGDSLPDPAPYRIHVAQALAYARSQETEAFFRKKLRDVSEPTSPFGLSDVRGDGSKINEVHQTLESELATRVRAQARRMGVSAATLFHAAWAVVVAQTSGRNDIVFGTVLLGRLQGSASAQRVLGMFINTLPVRLKIGSATAKQLVDNAQRELIELLGHEQASLAVAQRCSGVPASTPLFSTLLNYRHSVPDQEVGWSSAPGIGVLA